MALIRLVNLTKRFDEITALDHVTLTIADEEYVCVLGPTGAGKTTLLRVIAGLLHPDAGEIVIEGTPVTGVPPEKRNTMYMYQQFALFPHMNVWQNVSFGPTITDLDAETVNRLTREVLEMVRLGARRDAFPEELSGGMQQRVALARGIASGARILLLDEPFGALDARLRVDLRRQLRQLVKDQHLTVIHVTHDQEEALMTADRIVVLRGGRVEQVGTPKEIYGTPASIFVISFVGGANFIEGRVIATDESGSVIEIQDGVSLRVDEHVNGRGHKVVVAVRLEDTLIGPVTEDGCNRFAGRIESVLFTGDTVEYTVRLENGLTLEATVLLSEASTPYETGDPVTVSFLPEKCSVYPYPRLGLRRELEVI
jgi:ABC-type Fe3+/spermidine/putrescine transport system ATPase subunit